MSHLYGTETLALTELQQHRLQVSKTTGSETSKRNESRQAQNGGVKGRVGSAVELDRRVAKYHL